ncbi:hypothetical protein [Bordetella sp. LUAb4]|uniref:hypothetical protein n=1 Tax=Bordetella sp. LUAb4 TaxID=2843195 RepID=UPI001E3CFA58|nr:hypothetical protein [Bordetella sp. LUAb4]
MQLEADRTQAIYNALVAGDSPAAKQLAVDSMAQAVGIGAAGVAACVSRAKSAKYEPNRNAVRNMAELLRRPGFGNDLKNESEKTGQQYQGQSIYKATDDIGGHIRRGDLFYLDGMHKDHIEVFDKKGGG